MPAAGRADPHTPLRFIVEIDGVQSAAFSEVSGLESETEVIEYSTGADAITRKIPGLTKFGNITLKRGLTNNRELWDWRQSVVQGQVERKNGAIVLLDASGSEVLRFGFLNGWPCKWEGPALDARGNDVAIETLEIAHEGLELVT